MASRKPIEPGVIARVVAGVRNAFRPQATITNGPPPVAPGRPAAAEMTAPPSVDNGGWFGPLNPLTPAAPWTAGRQFDYMTGVNAVTLPREREAISFAMLRGLADGYDLLRLVIETRKDQLARCRWAIQSREAAAGKRKKDDPRTATIEAFLRRPDRDHDWAGWLRMLIEDMLVIDAACLYPRRDRAGRLWSLEIVDGATIKRIIDETGRTPIPPLPAYQQILKGVPTADFTANDLLYLMRNPRSHRIYGYSPVEQIIMTVNIALRRQTHLLDFYTEGSVPDAVCGVPDGWSPEQIRMFQDYWDSLLTGSSAERRRVRFVPGAMGSSFKQTKEGALKDELDEWLARIVCYALNVSPQWAVKQMNRASGETAKQQADEEGLGPLQEWVKGVMDWVIGQCFGYPDLEWAWVEETAVDPAVQASVGTTYVNAGVLSRNELREQIGYDPIPGGDVYLVTTPVGLIRLEDAGKPPPEPEPPEDPPPEGEPPEGKPPGTKSKPRDDKPLAKAAAGGALPPSDLARAWRRWLKRAGRQVAAQAAMLLPELAKAAGTDDQAPGDAGAAPAEAAAGSGGAGSAAIDSAIGALDWQAIEGISGQILAEAAKRGVAQGLPALQAVLPPVEAGEVQAAIGALTGLANERAVAVAAQGAADLVSGVTDVTRSTLKGLITRAEAEGWSVKQLAKAIQGDYAFSAERAFLIAQTEMAHADLQGLLIGWMVSRDKLGLKLNKRTVLGMNEDHCGECLQANLLGAIGLDEPFPSGDLAPPFHPRCTCALVAEPAGLKKAEGHSGGDPFDDLAKAGNPYHDNLGRFASAPYGDGGGGGGSGGSGGGGRRGGGRGGRHLGAMPVEAVGKALGRKLAPGHVVWSPEAQEHHERDHPEDVEAVNQVLSAGIDKPRYVGQVQLGAAGANTALYFPVPGAKGAHVLLPVGLSQNPDGSYSARSGYVVTADDMAKKVANGKIIKVK